MKVIDGKVQFGCDYQTYLEQQVLPLARKLEVELVLEMALDSELAAEVNHNRWIVLCPDCLGATFVWLDAPAQLCPNCWNGSKGYRLRRVVVPERYAEIEALLKERPLPQNRNWLPGETVDDLLRENQEHGLGAREGG